MSGIAAVELLETDSFPSSKQKSQVLNAIICNLHVSYNTKCNSALNGSKAAR